MDRPVEEENPTDTSCRENERASDYRTLAAQTPPIPPDETPSVIGFRELSGDELTQAQQDSALIQEIAPIRPYTKVAQHSTHWEDSLTTQPPGRPMVCCVRVIRQR